MVNIMFTVLSVAVFVTAMLTRGIAPKNEVDLNDTQVLSAEVVTSPTPTIVETVPTPVPTIEPVISNSIKISDWIYPNNKDLSQTISSLSFSTKDDPKLVVVWYSNKLKELGYVSTGVIQTRSNEKIQNSVSGSNISGEVSVDIRQDTKSEPVYVVVTTTDATPVNNAI